MVLLKNTNHMSRYCREHSSSRDTVDGWAAYFPVQYLKTANISVITEGCSLASTDHNRLP